MAGRMAHMLVRSVNILVDARMTPAEIGHVVGEKARASVLDLASRGLGGTSYTLLVDGQEGVSEDRVKLNGGMIEYLYARTTEAAAFAYNFCRQMSPYGGKGDPHPGDYYAGWLIIADGQAVELDEIPANSHQILIVNPAPYARRLEQSTGRTRPAYHITESARAATKRAFPALDVRREFVHLPGPSTSGWQVPYYVKGRQGKTRGSGEMLYPAVVITAAR